MSDILYGIRITADGRDVVTVARASQAELDKIRQTAKQTGEDSARAADQFTASLRKQADTIGLSRTQTLAYEASQHKLSAAQQQNVTASLKQIETHERHERILGRLKLAGAAAGAAIAAAFVAAGKASIDAALQAEQSSLRLGAVHKATGGSSGFQRPELDALAEDMKRRLGFDDDALRDAMAQLLTFRSVGRESFGDTLEMAANLSKVMRTDLTSSVLQLGKALEDPESGLTALRRSGVSFTASQREMIKELVETGHQATAITEILRIMKEQGLDGVAESMNQGLFRATNNLKLEWEDLLKAIGRSESVQGTTVAVFDGITGKLNEVRNVIENGTWFDKYLLLMGHSPLAGAVDLAKRATGYQPPKAPSSTDMSGAVSGYEMWEQGQERNRNAKLDRFETFSAQFATDREKMARELRKLEQFRGVIPDSQLAAAESGIRQKFTKKAPKAAAGEDPYPQLLKGLEQELLVKKELTVYDKLLFDLDHMKPEQYSKLTVAQLLYLEGLAHEGELKQRQERSDKVRFEAMSRDVETQRQAEEAVKSYALEQSKALKQIDFETDLLGRQKAGMSGVFKTQQDLLHGQLELDIQRETSIALRKLELDFDEKKVKLTGREREELEKLYELQRGQLPDAIRRNRTAQFEVAQQEAGRAEAKRFQEDIERGLIDSLYRGFEKGNDLARNFVDGLKNMFRTTVLTPVIKWIMSPITGSITSALGSLGIPGLANASGGGGGIGNLFSAGSSISNLFTGSSPFSTATNLVGNAAAGAGFLGASPMFGAVGGAELAGLAALEGGGIASAGMGAMSALSAAAPYIAAAVAAASALGIFGNKKSPAVGTGYQFRGDYSLDAGFSNFEARGHYKAGDRSGYDLMRTDAHAAILSPMIESAFAEFEKLAKSVKLDTGALRTATTRFDFTTSGIGQAQDDASKPEIVRQIASQWAALVPGLKEMAQANEDLIDTFNRVAQARRQADLNAIFGSMTGALQARDAVHDLFLSDLSPLTARERVARAQSGYAAAVAKGEMGDFGGYDQAARAYAQEARSFYTSSPDYTAIFNEIQSTTNDLVTDTLAEQSARFGEMGLQLKDVNINLQALAPEIAAALKPHFDAMIEAQRVAAEATVAAQQAAADKIASDQKEALQENTAMAPFWQDTSGGQQARYLVGGLSPGGGGGD